MAANGNMNELMEEEVERKPGVVKKISRITFTIGPLRQEDLSTPEMNKLMAMAQRFDITFDTVPILDSEQTDKLGYIRLPFEIRTQEYLLVLYDRLLNLKLAPSREMAIKFPEEFKRYVEETRLQTANIRKQKIEEEKREAEKLRRSIFATYVDKDNGKATLEEKFPEAKEIILRQYNFKWFGCMEFESPEKALEVMKKENIIEIEGQKVKLVRHPPDFEEKQKEKEKLKIAQQAKEQKQQQRKRPLSSPSGHGGGGVGRGSMQRGAIQRGPVQRGPMQRGPMQQGFGQSPPGVPSLLGSPSPVGRGYSGGRDYNVGIFGSPMGGGGMVKPQMYQNYGVGGYQGGYGGGFNSPGNFALGAKRKSDLGDFGGSPKKPFGTYRGGYGGQGGGGGGWKRY